MFDIFDDEQLFWTAVAAIGQVAGALATFLAVVLSLYLAREGRRPNLLIRIGERVSIGDGRDDKRLLMFSVANIGDRTVYVRSFGWRTGYFPVGPMFLQRKYAVQLSGGLPFGIEPRYELAPGAEVSTYVDMKDFLTSCSKKKENPFFSRDYPILGRKTSSIRGYIALAGGHSIYVKPEKAIVAAIANAERSET